MAEPASEPVADEGAWVPVRPGLSDPHGWLGATAPNGSTYAQDDLQRIHGVGPYLAGRLRDAGILTWRQVAEWDDDDMTLVSRRIGSFPDRIRREDWPASARALHEEAYGEPLA
jgi:predicted flap endonuclease-1-like 5' DNA nuclease